MAPSTIYTRASTSLSSSYNPSVLRSLTSSNIKRSRHVSVRNLWWWSRHNTWSSTGDEQVEERVQRHQKIMRHRYSRALRRRAMWDRDEGTSPWIWSSPERRFTRKVELCRNMSSTDPTKARLDDKHDDLSAHQKFWSKYQKDFENMDKNFESFKAAIDRAVEKDPYGTLFGRRLHSGPTDNNSSWISWLFSKPESETVPKQEPLASSNRRKIEIENLDKKPSPEKAKVPEASEVEKPVAAKQSKPPEHTEYIYDPISGRKVPQSSSADQPQSNATLLETLFAEHGSHADKPVKHHRIFGYRPEPSSDSTTVKPAKVINISSKPKGFESSRTREYQQLRAATLGTSIDTTFVYGGQLRSDAGAAQAKLEKSTGNVPEPDEAALPFSGTTYESKSSTILPNTKKSSSWLEKEGFQNAETSPKDTVEVTGKDHQKLEPSLDRIQSIGQSTPERKFIIKLQPAADRVQLSKPKEVIIPKPIPLNITRSVPITTKSVVTTPAPSKPQQDDTREDIDLLRASDIRAATKSARTTKQEAAQAKIDKRNELQNDFDQKQKRNEEIFVSDAKSLRAESSLLSRRIDEELLRRNSTPEKMSQVQKPSKEQASDKPIEAVRLENAIAESVRKQDDAQIEQLARGIRQVYEAERGPIDLSPAKNTSLTSDFQRAKVGPDYQAYEDSVSEFFAERRKYVQKLTLLKHKIYDLKTSAYNLEADAKDKSTPSSQTSASVRKMTELANVYNTEVDNLDKELKTMISSTMPAEKSGSSHPLSTASVKPGVPRYPSIERHTMVFEPRFIKLREEVKSIRTKLNIINMGLHDIRRSRLASSEPEAKSSNAQPLQPCTPAVEPKIDAASPPDSPYLMLIYNKATGTVDQTAMNRLPWSPIEKADKINPIEIMGNLNYPAAFVTHFVKLEKSGYNLSSGKGDMLIFKKGNTPEPVQPTENATRSIKPASKPLRDTIAAEEASSQPEITETIAQPNRPIPRQAATVLDDIPIEIPASGPTAPTTPNPTPKRIPKSPKIRRQEQVFSGTINVRSTPPVPPTENTSQNEQNSNSNSNSNESSFFSRAGQSLKRGVLGVAAFGAAAYTIGAVAEGIGAQAQADGDKALGPRTKVVMPTGQRPGIFSTESSRN